MHEDGQMLFEMYPTWANHQMLQHDSFLQNYQGEEKDMDKCIEDLMLVYDTKHRPSNMLDDDDKPDTFAAVSTSMYSDAIFTSGNLVPKTTRAAELLAAPADVDMPEAGMATPGVRTNFTPPGSPSPERTAFTISARVPDPASGTGDLDPVLKCTSCMDGYETCTEPTCTRGIFDM